MIVQVNCAGGKSAVQYGKSQFQVSDDGTLELPDYVAKSVCGLAGFSSSADLSPSAATLLAADEPSEANYLFWAYGKSLPDEDQRIAEAGLLLAQRGNPACSAT